MRRKLILWFPLIGACLLLGVFYRNLVAPASTTIASKMVNKPLPQFVAAAAFPEIPGITSASYADGKPRLLNVFASWCAPCIVEMPQLLALQKQGVQIDGLAVHDKPEDLTAFLKKNGNPFARIGMDPQSRTQIELGSAGLPESFIINGKGIIIYQHVGVINKDDMPVILSMMKAAQ